MQEGGRRETRKGRQPVKVWDNRLPFWVAYKYRKLISHSSGGWRSEIRVPAWLGGSPLPGCRWPSCPRVLHGRRGRELSGVSFIRALIHSPGFHPLDLITPTSPLPKTITLGIRISTCEICGDTNIQTTICNLKNRETFKVKKMEQIFRAVWSII